MVEGMDAKDEPVLDAEIVEESKDLTTTTPVVVPEADYTAAGVPTFDYVRDRIENRVATGIGTTELADATPEGKAVEDQFEARKKAGLDKLEEIRRSMRGGA
jgi:phage shock protein A